MSYNISLQHLPKSSDGKIEMIYHENLLNTFDQNSETWKSYSFENCFHHNASPLHLPLWKWLVNTIPLFCIHFIIVLIEKKNSQQSAYYESSRLFLEFLNSSSKSPWKYRATEKTPKEGRCLRLFWWSLKTLWILTNSKTITLQSQC